MRLATNGPRYVAYLLYGSGAEYQRELAFSTLSALRFLHDDPRGVRLCVLSDQPSLQFELGARRIGIDAQELAEWTHDGACPHRAKLAALHKALTVLGAPVALVDTDTCFVEHPAQLFHGVAPGASVMHAREYAIGEQALWAPLLERLGGSAELAGFRIHAGSPMFNSGVIGVHPSDTALVARAMQLLDALDGVLPIFNAEQFAIGTALFEHTELSTVEHVLHHYWGFSRGFVHVQIARLLAGFRPDRVRELARDTLRAELGFPVARLRDRLVSRVQAMLRGWDVNCRFAYQAFLSALACVKSDHAYANVWLATALQALSVSEREGSTAARARARLWPAFAAFDARAVSWIEPRLARQWIAFWSVA
ncbi:MAG TPA: hypothetical protein VJR89_38705 [Polyangiales bacterium]|nr:hypothetical protein [Polyangiales bacterium]